MAQTTHHIVGDGIAGLMLAWQFYTRGVPFRVYASPDKSSASDVAAGLMNPITGMRFVKTWLADELFPCAWATYREIEEHLNVSFIKPMTIYRTTDDPTRLNNWQARSQKDALRQYVCEMQLDEALLPYIPNAKHGIGVRGAKIETSTLLGTLRYFFEVEEMLVHQEVAAKDFSENDRVIFCEGYYATQNDLLSYIPIILAKGHYLECDIPDLAIDFVLQGRTSIIPQADGLYRIGSSYQWHFEDNQIDNKQIAVVTELLRETITLPFAIHGVHMGIRPTLADSRPILGPLPGHPNHFVFNGLGTKGFSLAPFFAAHLCVHLLTGAEIRPEVHIGRFAKR